MDKRGKWRRRPTTAKMQWYGGIGIFFSGRKKPRNEMKQKKKITPTSSESKCTINK